MRNWRISQKTLSNHSFIGNGDTRRCRASARCISENHLDKISEQYKRRLDKVSIDCQRLRRPEASKTVLNRSENSQGGPYVQWENCLSRKAQWPGNIRVRRCVDKLRGRPSRLARGQHPNRSRIAVRFLYCGTGLMDESVSFS
jgi:hypothetical protein